MKRINDKIAEVEKYLEELKGIAPDSFDEYQKSLEKKAACERYVEKIMEEVTDLAFLLIKMRRLRIPEDDADSFNILLENKLIDEKLCSKLKNAKGMKNIISHQYGCIDDEVVYGSIKEELEPDVRGFIGKIKNL